MQIQKSIDEQKKKIGSCVFSLIGGKSGIFFCVNQASRTQRGEKMSFIAEIYNKNKFSNAKDTEEDRDFMSNETFRLLKAEE